MPSLFLSKTHKHPFKFKQMWEALDILKAIGDLENEGYLGHINYYEIGRKMRENKSIYTHQKQLTGGVVKDMPSENLILELTVLRFIRMRKTEYVAANLGYSVMTFFWALSRDPFRQPQLIKDSLDYYGKKTDPKKLKKKVMAYAAQHP